MSNNLHCKIDNKEIELWQTPTRITNILMVTENGTVPCFRRLRGKTAKRVMNAYLNWVMYQRYEINLYHYDGKSNKEQYDAHIKHYTEQGDQHINEIKNLIKKCKQIEVWSM